MVDDRDCELVPAKLVAAEPAVARERKASAFPAFVEPIDDRALDLMLDADLTVRWMQQGRNQTFYGEGALVERGACWSRV